MNTRVYWRPSTNVSATGSPTDPQKTRRHQTLGRHHLFYFNICRQEPFRDRIKAGGPLSQASQGGRQRS